jgi:hypothetical protein
MSKPLKAFMIVFKDKTVMKGFRPQVFWTESQAKVQIASNFIPRECYIEKVEIVAKGKE